MTAIIKLQNPNPNHVFFFHPCSSSALCQTTKTMESISPSNPGALIAWSAAIIFLVANAKSLPLAYTVRLLPSLYRLLRPRLLPPSPLTPPRAPNPLSTPTPHRYSASPALFTPHTTTTRTVLLDIDVNLHKSNSTFFTDADISRAALLTTLLSPALAATACVPLLAAVQCTFKRSIAPLQAYDVSSRILAWDDRSLFVGTWFLKTGVKLSSAAAAAAAVLGGDVGVGKGVYAVMVSRYVCKAGRETVVPREVLLAAGLLVSVPDRVGEGGEVGLVAADKVEEAVKDGLRYVEGCML